MLMIEPTNICNLKCPMCPSGNGSMTRPRGRLDRTAYQRLIDAVGHRLLQIQLWNQGEPFIHPRLVDFIRYAKARGIMVITSTNGHFIRTDEAARELIQSGLDQLIFSLDGTNPETYTRYRVGGNFQRVMDALTRIARIRREMRSPTPIIELQFLVFRHNQHEIDALIQFAEAIGVDRISFKSAQVYTQPQAQAYLPDDPRFNRYETGTTDVRIKGRLPNWCKRLWLNPVVNWDGTLSPCCFDKDADWAMGNVFREEQTFSEVWRGQAFQRFRWHILHRRAGIPMCRNCTEGLPQPYAYIVNLPR